MLNMLNISEFQAIVQAEERKKQKEHMKILKQQVFIDVRYTSYYSSC